MIQRHTLRPVAGAGLVAGFAVGFAGCASQNFDSPSLSLTRAEMSLSSATLGMRIDNPSGQDLTIEQVDWSLVYGPLPVAVGIWPLSRELPAGQSYEWTETVRLTAPVLEPDAETIELQGRMQVSTPGGGPSSFESTAFQDTATVRRNR